MSKVKYTLLVALLLCFSVLLVSCKEPDTTSLRSATKTYTPIKKPTSTPIDDDTTLPEYGNGKKTGPYKGSDDAIIYRVDETTEQQYEEYVILIKKKGFKNVMSNEMNDNLYDTFIKLDKLIHISYIKASNRTMIVYETYKSLPKETKNESNEYKPLLTQIKLESKGVPEGMSYVFRLSDGTFFLIDGGWPELEHEEAKKLYNLLSEQAEGKEIVIRGWLLTHCHNDHIGAFNDFVEQYHDYVSINQIIYNFPPDEDIQKSDSPHMLDNKPAHYTNFRNVISKYLKGTDIVRIHSGYKFSYMDCEIEILQTYEDFYPQTIKEGGMNLSSTIFTVTVEGQRILFLSDATNEANKRLVKKFGSWLKSDMMQVAHHGVGGGTVEVYKTINAEYILYPSPLSFYENTYMYPENRYFLFESKTVKQIFTMAFGQFTLEFPYSMKEAAERIPGRVD